MNKKKIVVCGATGNQGSQVVSHLLTSNLWEVVALTRNPDTEIAKRFAENGVTVNKVDFDDASALKKVFEGAHGVFMLTQPWSADYKICNVANEILQGKNIIDAAVTANVAHLVMSSVLSFDDKPIGVSHADSKLIMEDYLKSSGLSFTIIRCSQFMENIGKPFFPVINYKIKGFVDADAKVPYISCKDIGRFTAQVFANKQAYIAQAFDLIGDIVSGDDLVNIFNALNSLKAYSYKSAPKFLLYLFAREFYTMRKVFEVYGRSPMSENITQRALYFKQIYPNATSFDKYLRSTMFL